MTVDHQTRDLREVALILAAVAPAPFKMEGRYLTSANNQEELKLWWRHIEELDPPPEPALLLELTFITSSKFNKKVVKQLRANQWECLNFNSARPHIDGSSTIPRTWVRYSLKRASEVTALDASEVTALDVSYGRADKAMSAEIVAEIDEEIIKELVAIAQQKKP